MTDKQKKFVSEYLVDLNGTQAAIRAGYSKRGAKGRANLLKNNPEIAQMIKDQMDSVQRESIAGVIEISEYLTAVMRGESRSSVVVVEGLGNGKTVARLVDKPPEEKERIRAAELLGKRYGMFSDRVRVDGSIPVVIKEDL